MPDGAPISPAESFAALLRWLVLAVETRSLLGRLARPMVVEIIHRLRRANQLVARIAAGRFFPRRTRQRRPGRRPPAPRLPRTFGWLVALAPETAASAGQLETLLRDPAMAALIAAAPVPMARALRPLCRMLGVRPPPPLAPPPKPRAPRKPRPAPAPRSQPRPRPRDLPLWLRPPPRRRSGRPRGPPDPA